jgi:hypothetical protein
MRQATIRKVLAGVQAVADFLRRSDHRASEPRSSSRESNPRRRLIRRSNRYLRHRPFFLVLDEGVVRKKLRPGNKCNGIALGAHRLSSEAFRLRAGFEPAASRWGSDEVSVATTTGRFFWFWTSASSVDVVTGEQAAAEFIGCPAVRPRDWLRQSRRESNPHSPPRSIRCLHHRSFSWFWTNSSSVEVVTGEQAKRV